MLQELQINWDTAEQVTGAKQLAIIGKDGRSVAPYLKLANCASVVDPASFQGQAYLGSHPDHAPGTNIWEIKALQDALTAQDCANCLLMERCNRLKLEPISEQDINGWIIVGNGKTGQKAANLISLQFDHPNIVIPKGIILTTDFHTARLNQTANPTQYDAWRYKIADIFDRLPFHQPIAIRSSAINEGPGGEYETVFFTKMRAEFGLDQFQNFIEAVITSYEIANPTLKNGEIAILIQEIIGRPYPESGAYLPDFSAIISDDNGGPYINITTGAGSTLTESTARTTKIYGSALKEEGRINVVNDQLAFFTSHSSEIIQTSNAIQPVTLSNHGVIDALKFLLAQKQYFELAIVDDQVAIVQVDKEPPFQYQKLSELPPVMGTVVYEQHTLDLLREGIRTPQGIVIIERDADLEMLSITNALNRGYLLVIDETRSSELYDRRERQQIKRKHICNASVIIETQEYVSGLHLKYGTGKEHWRSLLKNQGILYHGIEASQLFQQLPIDKIIEIAAGIKLIPAIQLRICQTQDTVRVEITGIPETITNIELPRGFDQLITGVQAMLTDFAPDYNLSNDVLSRVSKLLNRLNDDGNKVRFNLLERNFLPDSIDRFLNETGVDLTSLRGDILEYAKTIEEMGYDQHSAFFEKIIDEINSRLKTDMEP